MIDVIQALELFETCADEMATEDADRRGNRGGTGGRRMTLTARALAKRQLQLADLSRFPLRGVLGDAPSADEPTMTLGAMMVFRTADRFGRAGASRTRTIEALYRAVHRYTELIPCSLRDGLDETAIARRTTDESVGGVCRNAEAIVSQPADQACPVDSKLRVATRVHSGSVTL
jgi:hypothetical protein